MLTAVGSSLKSQFWVADYSCCFPFELLPLWCLARTKLANNLHVVMTTIYNIVSSCLSCTGQGSNVTCVFLIIDLSLLSCLLYLVAVLGSFLAALNKFIADRYSWNHTVSEYHVYEFFRVSIHSHLP